MLETQISTRVSTLQHATLLSWYAMKKKMEIYYKNLKGVHFPKDSQKYKYNDILKLICKNSLKLALVLAKVKRHFLNNHGDVFSVKE